MSSQTRDLPRARYGSLAACTGALLVGRMIWEIMDTRGTTRLRRLGTLLLVLLIAEGAWYSRKAVKAPPGYSDAVAYMESHKGPRHISSYPIASAAYAGSRNVLSTWPENETELHDLYQEGYNYVLMDFIEVALEQFYFLVPEGPKKERLIRSREVMTRIKETIPPVFVCPNPPVGYLHNIFEVNHNFSMSTEFYRRIQDRADALIPIRIYDLEAYFANRPFTPGGEGPPAGSPPSP